MRINKALLVTKLKATTVHLLLSLGVFVYLAYQIYYHWYPEPYFSIDGGWQGIRLVAAVDLVLGPFITFLIFDLAKSRRHIVFDLVIIALIQLGALSYGVYATYTQRPVVIVLIDEFMTSGLMQHFGDTLESEGLLAQYSDEKPPIIYAHVEQTTEAIAEIQRIKVEEKILEHAQQHLYQPKSGLRDALIERQPLFFERMEFYQDTARYEEWLKQNQKDRESVLVARFTGRYGFIWLVFDRDGNYLSYF